MKRLEIKDFDDPRVADYQNLKDSTLARDRSRFIVEGRGTLEVLLCLSPFQPNSILLSERTARSIESDLEAWGPTCPVFVAEQSVMDQVVGFPIHRGCLAVCDRPEPEDPLALAKTLLREKTAPRLLVLEGLRNLDNVGGIFRNAMALGGDGVILCPETCDPFYRKAIRTSMGGTLTVPFARAEPWPDVLGEIGKLGYLVLGLDPAESGLDLFDLDDRLCEGAARPIALLVGTEGPGISDTALRSCDESVRIDMEAGVDSLNVAMAAGIALHALRRNRDRERTVS